MLARNKFMTSVVLPGMATRTASYAQGLYEDFAERNNIMAQEYPPGSLVMRRVNPRGSKMKPTWEGPFFVVRRSRGGPYLLRDSLSNELAEKVPVSQL